MTGLSNYSAANALQWVTGVIAQPPLPNVFLALMVQVDTDAGTGGSEVVSGTGTGYFRTQVAGTAVTGVCGTGNGTLTITGGGNVPAWIQNGMSISGGTGTSGTGPQTFAASTAVTGTTSTTISFAPTPNGSAGGSLTVFLSAFSYAGGTAPNPQSIGNDSVITFPAALQNWGTVIAFELRDGSVGGNLLLWDYLGNFSWLPATVATASGTAPSVITVGSAGYAVGTPVIWSNEYGGALASGTNGNFTTSGSGALIVTNPQTANTFAVNNGTAGVQYNGNGNGLIRQITEQSIPSGVTASFAAQALTATAA